MKAVLIVILVLVALVGLVVAVGLALPRNHQATSRITLPQPPAEVWAVVRDLGSLLGTWKDLKAARRLPTSPDQDGKETWEQNAGGFTMRLVVEESDSARRLVTRIDAPPDADFGGRWIYELEPDGAGTRVTVTEDGWVSNPLFRTMMRVMGTHKSVDGYLGALGRKLGQAVRPVHVE